MLGWKMAERRFFRLVLLLFSRACSRHAKSSSLIQEMLQFLLAVGLLHTHRATNKSATMLMSMLLMITLAVASPQWLT